MTSRRPNTANDAGLSRMPFASAEALLWGPELKKQHTYLLTEMRALQKQHEGYDARIRATEAVTEAAKAAAAQIHDLKQQLSAIEAKDDDKAFEKWASSEITRLGVFFDTNKNVRQKQSELDGKVSHISKDLDRFLRDTVGLEGVLRRLDVLEHGRREDAERIQGLEKEVNRLRSMRASGVSYCMQSRTGLESRKGVEEELIAPGRLNAEISDLMIESDNEENLLPRVPTYEGIQVPQSPEVQETEPSDTVVTSPTKDHSIMSARLRLLQRPSIHNARLPRPLKEQNVQPSLDENPGSGPHHSSPPLTQLVCRKHWHKKPVTTPLSVPTPAPVPIPAPQPQVRGRSKANISTSEAPPTQPVERRPPEKRRQPDSGTQTQRQTRSQAKKSQTKEELQAVTGASVVSEVQPVQKTEPVSPPRKKFKTTPAKKRAGNKAKSSIASQAASKDTKQTQNQCKVEEPSEQESVTLGKSASTTTRSRKTKALTPSKKNPILAPPPLVNTNPRGQKRLMVKIGPRQRAQENIDHLQEQISASYSYCYDEL